VTPLFYLGTKMTVFLTFIIFSTCLAAMAVGLIFAKKALRKYCGNTPEDCACRAEDKDPNECDKQ